MTVTYEVVRREGRKVSVVAVRELEFEALTVMDSRAVNEEITAHHNGDLHVCRDAQPLAHGCDAGVGHTHLSSSVA